MKPVTLPLLKSLYYVLFATVVVIVLCSCFNTSSRFIFILFLEFLLFYQFNNFFSVCFIAIGYRKLRDTMNLFR
jgi:hypothetical protein